MKPPLRLALLSFWHVHAEEYALEAQNHPETELVAIWDENSPRGIQQAKKFAVPFVADLETIWNDASIHGIILTSATSEHHRILLAAAKAGKHIFTEKVIAASTREAAEIVNTIEAAGLEWMVSLPRMYAGYTKAIQKIITSGELGRITQARVRVSHNGLVPSAEQPNGWLPKHFCDPLEAQGGAMIDFGVHPMYLLRLFLGMPNKISANYGNVFAQSVEDNAAALLHYPNGAIGIAEVGFVNPHHYFSIEIHGTKVLLHYGSPTEQLLLSTGRQDGSVTWEAVAVPADDQNPFKHWVEHLLHETNFSRTIAEENQRIAIDLTTLMEATNKAAHNQKTFELNN